MQTPTRSLWLMAALLASLAAHPANSLAQKSAAAALPDAPQAAQNRQHPLKKAITPLANERTVEPGEQVLPLSPGEKVKRSLRLSARPIHLVPALYSAGYEQLTGGNPKFGSDSGAFGERLGAALLRSTSTRILSDGVFASILHQDPRYYRVAQGSIVHRGLLSAEQVLVRRCDDRTPQMNYSGLLGRAAAAVLTLAYYPEPSANSRVVFQTFATSIATNAGGNLVLEFLPDVAEKVPYLRKLHIQ